MSLSVVVGEKIENHSPVKAESVQWLLMGHCGYPRTQMGDQGSGAPQASRTVLRRRRHRQEHP
jgi:hypothetical protein